MYWVHKRREQKLGDILQKVCCSGLLGAWPIAPIISTIFKALCATDMDLIPRTCTLRAVCCSVYQNDAERGASPGPSLIPFIRTMPSGTQALPPDFYSVLRSVYQNDAERERLRMCGEQVLGIGKNVVLKCAAGVLAQTPVDQPRS